MFTLTLLLSFKVWAGQKAFQVREAAAKPVSLRTVPRVRGRREPTPTNVT